MAYTYLTYAAAVTALAQRLQDPSLIYWNQPNQLLNCIIEAARLYQALTYSYKRKMTFSTSVYVPYYSLTAQPNSPLANVATDVEVVNNVLATLLEPPLTGNGSSWIGTGQFTFAQLQQSLQNRLNRFIGESGRQVAQQTISGVTPQNDLVALPDAVVDVRRAVWLPAPLPGATTPPPGWPMGRIDEWAEQAYLPRAAQNAQNIPVSYSVYGTGPLQLRLAPPPLNSGTVDCIFVQAGAQVNLNPQSPVALGVPDDVSAGLKYGVLADLLGTDGPSRDYTRSQYCEQRYREYVDLARIYPSVLTATINEQTCGWGSVFDLDSYQPDWMQNFGVPGFIGMCGRHLACIGQIPDDGTAGGNPGGNYGVGLWTVANMPVPGIPGNTYLQIGRDAIDPVLDYAQHVASLQMAGAEFEGTTRQFQNLIAFAKTQNGRLEAISFYKGQLEQPSRKSEIEVARVVR